MGLCCIAQMEPERYEPLIIMDNGDKTELHDFESLKVFMEIYRENRLLVVERLEKFIWYAVKVLMKFMQ